MLRLKIRGQNRVAARHRVHARGHFSQVPLGRGKRKSEACSRLGELETLNETENEEQPALVVDPIEQLIKPRDGFACIGIGAFSRRLGEYAGFAQRKPTAK